MSASTVSAGSKRLSLPRPAHVLIASAIIALASLVAVAFDALWAMVVLGIAAVVVVVVGTLVAMRRGSRTAAPLAIALVALVNPLVLGGLAAHVTQQVGVVTVSAEHGVTLWSTYPGVAGWDPPDVLEPVDVVAIAQGAPRALRIVVDETGGAHEWSWSLAGESGAGALPNGFGGDSMFWFITAPSWATDDFDGSDAQRDTLLQATEEAAQALELTRVDDLDGDVGTGDGTRAWSDGLGGELLLSVAGSEVVLDYTGGPFFAGDPDEYAERMAPFEGMELPETLDSAP